MIDPSPRDFDYETPPKRDDAITFRQGLIAVLALIALGVFYNVMMHFFPMGG